MVYVYVCTVILLIDTYIDNQFGTINIFLDCYTLIQGYNSNHHLADVSARFHLESCSIATGLTMKRKATEEAGDLTFPEPRRIRVEDPNDGRLLATGLGFAIRELICAVF